MLARIFPFCRTRPGFFGPAPNWLLVVAFLYELKSQNELNASCMEATTQRSLLEAVSSTTLELGKLPCPMTSSNPSFPQLRHAHVQSQLTPSLHYSGTLLMVAGALSPPGLSRVTAPSILELSGLDSGHIATDSTGGSAHHQDEEDEFLCQSLASLRRMPDRTARTTQLRKRPAEVNEARHLQGPSACLPCSTPGPRLRAPEWTATHA